MKQQLDGKFISYIDTEEDSTLELVCTCGHKLNAHAKYSRKLLGRDEMMINTAHCTICGITSNRGQFVCNQFKLR